MYYYPKVQYINASLYLGTVKEETVDDVDGAVKGHDGEEEGEKPGQRDHGEEAERVEQGVQGRQVLLQQVLEHPCTKEGVGLLALKSWLQKTAF